MKSKRLVSIVMSTLIIGGGLLVPNSPIYKLTNHNTEQTVHAKDIGGLLNLEKRYNVLDAHVDNPSLEHMLKIAKPATKDMLSFDKGDNLGMFHNKVPHDGNWYYTYCYNDEYEFIKILDYKIDGDKSEDRDIYNIYGDMYCIAIKGDKVTENWAHCFVADMNEGAFKELDRLGACVIDMNATQNNGLSVMEDYKAPSITDIVKPKPKPSKPEVKPSKPTEKPNTSGGAVNTVAITRLSGKDRYETNMDIIRQYGGFDNLVICYGQSFPDALAASPLAHKNKAPIMLVQDKLNDSQLAMARQHNLKKVYLIGSESVVPKEIENQLKSMGVKDIKRLGGSDRFETCSKVCQEVGFNNGFIVANGDNFPDALTVAPIASNKGMPIVLTKDNYLPQSIKELIKGKSKSNNYVVGSSAVVSEDIRKEINAKRISGSNRYETNLAILKEFEKDLDFSKVYVARGDNFPDALSVTALASSTKSPIVLSEPTSLDKGLLDSIKGKKYSEVRIIGSEAVTPFSIVEKLRR